LLPGTEEDGQNGRTASWARPRVQMARLVVYKNNARNRGERLTFLENLSSFPNSCSIRPSPPWAVGGRLSPTHAALAYALRLVRPKSISDRHFRRNGPSTQKNLAFSGGETPSARSYSLTQPAIPPVASRSEGGLRPTGGGFGLNCRYSFWRGSHSALSVALLLCGKRGKREAFRTVEPRTNR
jgi:hypothetical protein